jgi:hypothetical protein
MNMNALLPVERFEDGTIFTALLAWLGGVQ